jgi:acetolactate synthase-1/2/3 large subunit
VWLDIPVDVQGTQVNEDKLPSYVPPIPYSQMIHGHIIEEAREVATLLQNCTRPVLLAGYGIQASGAEADFLNLAEILGAPVLTTWKEMGIMADNHPLYIGRPGKIGQRAANFAQQNCDLLISIGARLDFEQTAFQPRHFAFKAKRVVVDADHSELAKLDMDIDVSIACDAGEFIRCLTAKIQPLNYEPWLTRCLEWKKKYPVSLPEYKYCDDITKVNSYLFMDDLSDVASDTDVLTPGSSGQSVEVFMQGWKVKQGQKVVFAPALGPMGFDIPMALGACIASGGKRTICITGDGGFQLNLPTLETIRNLNLPIKLFVFNNGGYGSIMSMQRNYFDGRYVGSNPESGLTFPELYKIAEAYNIQYYKIMAGLLSKPTIKKVMEYNNPVICEVMVDEKTIQQPRVSSTVNTNGELISMPMEDLWPFLPRDEFEANMS